MARCVLNRDEVRAILMYWAAPRRLLSLSSQRMNRVMQLIVYPRLRRNSKKAMLRRRQVFGNVRLYCPQSRLVQRLRDETGLSAQEFWEQFEREREWLYENRRYYI